VLKKVFGLFARFSARRALLFPFLAELSSLNFLAETNAISLMEKTPLSKIKNRMIKISISPGYKHSHSAMIAQNY
jgi:hypothetical protein